MIREILFASNNPGKLTEVSHFAEQYGVRVLKPQDLCIDIDVVEDGTTFSENASLKLQAFLDEIDDPDLLVVADDSGITIDALGGEPGIKTRRWAGHKMTDDEIIDYCLERMKHLNQQDRTARFIATMAFATKNTSPKVVTGEIVGEILAKPVEAGRREGFPFRTLFYVTAAKKMLYEIHDASLPVRSENLTHREQALIKVFNSLDL